MIQLFTDTDCDMTPSLCAKYGYKLIAMPYAIDRKEVKPYEDFTEEEFDFHNYYDTLRGGAMPTTSCISEPQYIEYFEPTFAAGDDIFYVHFSAAMTNTFNVMKSALEKLSKKYPERKFYEVDCRGITINALYTVLWVGERFKEGMPIDEIIAGATELTNHVATYFIADDLKFFARSGRVSGVSAAMGNMLGIRPVMNMNDEGKMGACGKERGRGKALARIIQYMEELGDDVKNHQIIIGHTDALDLLEKVTELIKEKYGEDTEITVVNVNPTAGAHCGPNALGVAFYATKR